MDRRRLLLSAAGLLVATPGLVQAASPPAVGVSVLAGKWTYRSFHNRPALVDGDSQKALRLIFAAAVFTFEINGTSLKGALDWQGEGLDLLGTIQPANGPVPLSVAIVGSGRPKTDTDGWEYDYRADLASEWPNGVGQVPALVGTVIRAKPHEGGPAGYVASFIAVKQT
ncbi:hypothetical protein [Bradyrhizobium pachyrhizi]|uniref:hypothetical protein n=1 Tax=Bradyrhizobium pachyrhizi TaxID=280333 RepID=UPI001FCF8FCC|nr:hypothetical protein [Bradyrhizobium pachyrhizi]